MARRRVVVTGLGTVNPIGNTVPAYWQALLAGKSGIAPLTQFDTAQFKVKFGGEVKAFDPSGVIDAKNLRRLDRFTQFALVAADQAVTDCGLDFSKLDPFRGGGIICLALGGCEGLR